VSAADRVRSPRWWRKPVARWGLRLGVGVVLGVVAVQVVLANTAELAGAGGYLERANGGWIAVAAVAECLSYLNFTVLQRRLLSAGGLHLGMPFLGCMSLAGNAISNTLPAGGAFATVFAYRQFRRRGADEALTTWVVVAFTALTSVALAVLAIVGLLIAGEDGGVSGLVPLVVVLLVGPAVAVAVLLRPRLLLPTVVPVLRAVSRAVGRPRRDPGLAVSRLVERLEAVSPRGIDWAAGLTYAAGNWIADCSCLVAAFAAVGGQVPWRGLLLAYGAAQVVANLPVTPGGLGVVEGSLTVALVAFGGSTAQTVAAVLLYRILSFWVVLPLGWAAWVGLEVNARRHPMPVGVLTGTLVDEPGQPDRLLRAAEVAP